MTLVDAIGALDVVDASGAFSALPLVDIAEPVTETNLIFLSRAVIDPPAAISPDSVDLDYGLLPQGGAPVSRTVTIQNIGGQDLLIGTIGGIDGLTAPFSFSAGADNCSGQTLVSRATCTVQIELAAGVLGDLQDSFDVPSNDVNQPGLVITVRGTGVSATPVLDVQPAALDFGNVGTGQPRVLAVTVSNLGGGQLQPLGSLFSGAGNSAFSISDDTCNAASLNIGETCTLSVKLLSFSPEALAATLDVSADPGGQSAIVSLSANVTLLEPDIQLSAGISVPDIRFDASGRATLSISNAGVDDLYVSAVDVLGTDAALFEVATTRCIDVAIAPQSQCTEVIRFNPAVAGEFSALLRVQSNGPDSPVIDVPVSATASQDDDGVSDAIEQAAPNGGDLNLDGLADAQQAHVASLPSVSGEYVALETSVGTLAGVQAIQGESLGNVPTIGSGSLEFAQGFFGFIVDGVPTNPDMSGGSVTVTLYLPAGQSANSYFKFGLLPGEPSFLVPEHWYSFPFDSASQTGAEFVGNKVILHLVDGGAGDSDQTVNGRIVDPARPAVLNAGSGSSGGGGGCSVWTKNASGSDRTGLDFLALFAGLLILRLFTFRATAIRE